MAYNLISGNIISAITGGVFSFVRSFTVSDSIQTSPAYVLASYIIDQAIGVMTDPDDGLDWPLYVSYSPDHQEAKTDIGTVYDTTGLKDGRFMEGPVVQHYGVQLRIRSDLHTIGWAKAEAIAVALDAVHNQNITINAVEYQIQNVSRTSPVISLGIEKGTKNRRLFTVNFMVTLKRIT